MKATQPLVKAMQQLVKATQPLVEAMQPLVKAFSTFSEGHATISEGNATLIGLNKKIAGIEECSPNGYWAEHVIQHHLYTKTCQRKQPFMKQEITQVKCKMGLWFLSSVLPFINTYVCTKFNFNLFGTFQDMAQTVIHYEKINGYMEITL